MGVKIDYTEMGMSSTITNTELSEVRRSKEVADHYEKLTRENFNGA